MSISDRLLLAAFVGWLGFSTARLAGTFGWPRTNGTVIDVHRTEVYDSRNAEAPSVFRDIEYTYTVDDTEYTGTKVWRGFDIFNFHFLPIIGVDVQEGQRVVVYYDPEDPATAVLSRAYSPSELLMLLFAPYVIWVERRKAKRTRT